MNAVEIEQANRHHPALRTPYRRPAADRSQRSGRDAQAAAEDGWDDPKSFQTFTGLQVELLSSEKNHALAAAPGPNPRLVAALAFPGRFRLH